MISLIEQHRQGLVALCRRFRVQRLEVFGSAATGDGFDETTSDLDFLVEFAPMEPREHARAYFGLLDSLEDLFGQSVDLVEAKAVGNPYFLESINQTRTVLYAA